MPLLPTLLVAIASLGNALALPQGTHITGPITTFPQPFASNTSIGFFTGKASTAGSNLGSVSQNVGAALDGCGIKTSEGTIKTMYCTSLISSSISIGQTANGSCTFTLFADTNNCDVLGVGDALGYNKHQIVIPNGHEETCIGTGVLDGGRFQKASGVWACG